MDFLRSLWGRSTFSLPPFEPAPLEFEPCYEALNEAVLDHAVAAIAASPPAARPIQAMPTAVVLRAKLECHLQTVQDSQPVVDAAAELREALAGLRRSLG